MGIGLLLASLAAIAFGSGTFVQHLSAREVEAPTGHRPTSRGLVQLLARLIRSPKWLLGQGLAGGGTATQFAALAFAPVAVVEPIVATGLVVALTLEAIRLRRRPAPRLLAGLAFCIGGLIVFLLFSRATGMSPDVGLGTGLLLLAAGLVLALVSRAAPSGRVGAMLSGAAAGATLGVAVVAVAVTLFRLKTWGVLSVFGTWRPYVALVVGFLATAATQQAYARGRLAWSLPALTVADPLVAALLSVLLLGERLDPGGSPVWVAGALVSVVGVALTASTRPLRLLATAGGARAPAHPAGSASGPSPGSDAASAPDRSRSLE